MHTVNQELNVPPHDLEAEKALLGCVLLNPRVLDDLDGLRPADFYWQRHGKLFEHLVAMCEGRKAIDSLLLVEQLKAHGDLEAVGGVAYIAELMGCVPYAHHAAYYARIVREKAKKRGLVELGHTACRMAYDDGTSVEQAIDATENALLRLGSDATEHKPFSAAEAAAEARRVLEEARYRDGTLGLPTGLATYDAYYGGLFAGELIVVAARTSIGKTSLALQIATHNAMAGRLVYFASCEMAASELLLRSACSLAGIPLQAVRSGRASDAEHDRVEEALRQLSGSALVIDDRPELSVATIRRETRRLVRKGLRLVVVDYLQIITPPDRKLQRYEQIGDMTRQLKSLARDLGVPVLVLAQLSRAAEAAEEPKLSHLRESGSIEQDADVVLLLHRPEEGIEADGDAWAADMIVGKNRNGPVGRLRLDWDAAVMQFRVHLSTF